jgi:hypothetical protein
VKSETFVAYFFAKHLIIRLFLQWFTIRANLHQIILTLGLQIGKPNSILQI